MYMGEGCNGLKTKNKRSKKMTRQNSIGNGQEPRSLEELSLLLENVAIHTVGELQNLYEEFSGEATKSRNKPSLIRRVSACIRERLDQGRDEAKPAGKEEDREDAVPEPVAPLEEVELGKPADVEVSDENTPGGRGDHPHDSEQKPRRSRRRYRDPRLPAAGAVLCREYHGVLHEVTVLEEGFTYNGRHYGSLSRIATEIASVQYNGFVFFKKSLIQASAT
jgi:hypothetical protein